MKKLLFGGLLPTLVALGCVGMMSSCAGDTTGAPAVAAPIEVTVAVAEIVFSDRKSVV